MFDSVQAEVHVDQDGYLYQTPSGFHQRGLPPWKCRNIPAELKQYGLAETGISNIDNIIDRIGKIQKHDEECKANQIVATVCE